jgi:hypothetical protein
VEASVVTSEFRRGTDDDDDDDDDDDIGMADDAWIDGSSTEAEDVDIIVRRNCCCWSTNGVMLVVMVAHVAVVNHIRG